MKDNVKCTNCEFRGLVRLGSDVCPNCLMLGTLAWIEDEPQEIEEGNTMMYVYVRSEPNLWTVGHYDPFGDWQPEGDYDNKEEAAARVAYLNGGK